MNNSELCVRNKRPVIRRRFFALHTIIISLFASLLPINPGYAVVNSPGASQTILFNNLPRVALLVKEQYVDPKRIKPDAMLASILESLESRITKLVVTLPKSLEEALETARATEEKPFLGPSKQPAKPDVSKKEQLVLDLGGVKKVFDYEPQQSLWGMIFKLRDIARFIEVEAQKQGLTKASKGGEEPIDWEKSETGAINGMLSTLDPHSVYLEPKYARDLTLTTKGEFGGIGIVISVRDGYLTVISPIDETPAAKAGVKGKDRIVKIDDDSAINMDLNDAVNMLRGKPDTPVRITVQRANQARDMEFTLKRAIIKVDSVAYALLDQDIGYLRIKAFQGNTAQDVKEGILAMKKKSKGRMNGLVLDLRGNPGGLLREAVEVSSLFLDGGEVVSTQGARADSRQVEMAAPGELDPAMKVAILADGGSASASEIVAGALKSGGPKNGRGVVIGERTFGKGSVQMLFDFPSGKAVEPAALKLTIAEYFGPNSKSMQNIGVDPDVALSAVQASKLESLKIFPEVLMREEDLMGHLSPDRPKPKQEQSLVTLEYLAPPPDEDGTEYGKLDVARLKNDFAVKVASEVVKAAHGSDRKDLLQGAQEVKASLQDAEYKKISAALKKYGIDWSQGQTSGKSGLKLWVSENKGVVAGNKMKLAVKVKNTSDQTFYQVHGITHSKTPLFDQKEFLFGKLQPGQEIEREVVLEIPKDVLSRKDLLSVELRDTRREKLNEIDVPLEIKGLGRPRIAHMVVVDDTKSHESDGKVQQGEDVDLHVFIKNVGDGRAFEPTVLLKNDSGSKVFLKNGRFQSKELLPNQETKATFSFRVKEPSEYVDFEIQITDGQMHDVWRDKIRVPLAKKHHVKAIHKALALKSKEATLFDRPHGKKIALLHEGVKLESLTQDEDYFMVRVDQNLNGFVKKSEVKEGVKGSYAAGKTASDYYAINYDRTPAQVAMQFGDNSGWSRTESGRLTAQINSADPLSGILVYVNGKKVLYKDIKNGQGPQKIDFMVNLKPGVNSISLFAKENANFGQRENITVYYDNEGRAERSLKTQNLKAQVP